MRSGRRRNCGDQRGNFGFVRIPYYVKDARQRRQVFGSALGVAAGSNNLCRGIGCVEFADRIASLRIGCRGHCARVHDDHVCAVGCTGELVTLRKQLLLDRSGIRLRGAASELFDMEGRHGVA